MKQYLVSALVSVDEVCDGRRVDADMLKRLVREYCIVGKIDRKIFRGRVVMNIKNIQTVVSEIKGLSGGEG